MMILISTCTLRVTSLEKTAGSSLSFPRKGESIPGTLWPCAPVIYISASPLILIVHPSVQAKTTEELIALAKAKRGELSYASGPLCATPHLSGALFKFMTGTKIVHIPFKGIGLALNDVIAGRVQMNTDKNLRGVHLRSSVFIRG